MSRVVDLHPELLLDRDASGELTEDERARLEKHLASCAACRFERQLRADFADELASDVTPSERLALAGLSSQPPSAVPVPVDDTHEPVVGETREVVFQLPRRSPPRRAFPARRVTWLLAAAAVFAVSVAGATGAGQRAWSRLVGPAAPAVPAAESAPKRSVAKHTAPHRVAPPAPVVTSEPAREIPSADVLAPPPPVVASSPVVARRAASSADGASSLFEAATEARRQGSYGRALELQRDLVSRYPRSREAHVARETMGRLLLDRGDPAGAVASFDAYLAGGSGELGEEAMVGRATALERLGRSGPAADAWRALLAAYPETPYASHARSRLGSLSVR